MKKLQQLSGELLKLKKTRLMASIGLAVAVAVFLTLMFSAGFYSNIQLRLGDFLYGGDRPLDDIIIVAVDDKSLQEIGRWPWDRNNFTQVIKQLEDSKVIGFDIAFFEPSDNNTDANLANAMREHGQIVLPVEYTSFKQIGNRVIGDGMLEPIPGLREVASRGYINVNTDLDGMTRAVNLDIEGKPEHFSAAVMRLIINKQIPEEKRYLVNYIGPPGTYTRYSFVDVLEGKHADSLDGKIVLIGATAPDLHDSYFVPTSSGKAMPGVEIHANILQQMLTGKEVKTAPAWVTVLTILIVALVVAAAVFFLPVWISTAVSFGILIIYTFIAISAFGAGWIINMIYAPATVLTTYTATIIYHYLSEKKSRKKVLGAFEKYVSKDVIKHILEHPDRLKLGGDKRTITVFFSDIRGFTTISEKLSPEQLVHLLNEYLTEMTNIILEYNGVVDKYMGDAIMAFWNAPLKQPKHAERACVVALKMGKRLEELQKKWSDEGVPHLEIGIGLNTGPAVVGNMGSYDRFDYTAMGDTVNLGSRLEGLNKPYGTRIIISESTKQKIGKRFIVRRLDKVQVKGKKEPITIYDLIGFSKGNNPDFVNQFETGLKLYFKKDWKAAIKQFEQADMSRKKATGDNDKPSQSYIERCKVLMKKDPGEGWDGVWVMKTK
ncbi:adenylate/guanylate cyclase domain-containing protein [Candidatus Woesearchaeota archaeon]|nr:adenylate/guanylate cyclase domain-containing protein [Candidatus Woesearchaeota archaeon]